MPSLQSLTDQWYFHGPNLLMAALIYVLLLRFVVGLFVRDLQASAVLRLLRAATQPVVGAVGWLTPRLMPESIVVLLATVWLTAARILLYFGCIAAGVRPSIGS